MLTVANQLGADPDQLRALARQFRHEASGIDGAERTVSSKLDSAWWQGQDAARFTQTWHGQHKGRLGSITDMLRQIADQLDNEARRQEIASR